MTDNVKILLADDQLLPRQAIKKALESAGYKVVTAPDGWTALELLMLEGADIVLTDIRMPTMNGIQLLHQIKQRSQVPVVLMTGFSELCDAAEAHAMGAAGFLAKPFRRDEMTGLIRSLLPGASVPVPPPSEEEFSKIPVEDFICGSEIQFDIYVRLSEKKFVKVAHQGEDIERERIQVYKQKGVHFLYLKKEDYSRYLSFNIELGRLATESSKISNPKKLHLIRHTGETLVQHVRFEGMNQETYEHSKSFIETTLSVLAEDESILNLLNTLSGHTDYLYAHSVAVSMIAVMLARSVGWSSHPTLFKLAMGGLFHDIGKKDLDPALVSKMRKDLTPGEVRLLEAHPTRGLEILGEIKSIPGDVVQVVYQHHENCLGIGYPRGLTRNHIHPMARLVAVADEFCNLVFKGPKSAHMTPIEAVHRIQQTGIGRFDPDFLAALPKLFEAGRI